MKIFWTPKARKTYLNILEYLAENCSARENVQFNNKVEKMLGQIQKNPKLFVAGTKNQNIRREFIVKQVSII
jgi:plasmid stabilization system protein ParE